jgi:putative hemolysin
VIFVEYIEIEILAIVVLICFYALFSGLEIAIVGTRRSKVMRLYRKKVRGSYSLFKLKSNPSRMTSIKLISHLTSHKLYYSKCEEFSCKKCPKIE